MNRFSVLYLLNEQYHHIGCETRAEADSVLARLTTDNRRAPVGIYDSKTELFDWEPGRQEAYNQASIGEQGSRGDQVITIAQALRRRDASWHPSKGFHRPSFFA